MTQMHKQLRADINDLYQGTLSSFVFGEFKVSKHGQKWIFESDKKVFKFSSEPTFFDSHDDCVFDSASNTTSHRNAPIRLLGSIGVTSNTAPIGSTVIWPYRVFAINTRKGLAVHYRLLSELIEYGVTAGIPQPDTGEDLWFDRPDPDPPYENRLIRVQVKSLHTIRRKIKKDNCYEYTMNLKPAWLHGLNPQSSILVVALKVRAIEDFGSDYVWFTVAVTELAQLAMNHTQSQKGDGSANNFHIYLYTNGKATIGPTRTNDIEVAVYQYPHEMLTNIQSPPTI